MGVIRREMDRLCYAKLYEIELMSCAERRARGASDQLAQSLARALSKATRDYRDLDGLVRHKPHVAEAKPHSERVEDILGEIIDIKRDWLCLAQRCAASMPDDQREILIRICESEQEEIYNLKRCLS